MIKKRLALTRSTMKMGPLTGDFKAHLKTLTNPTQQNVVDLLFEIIDREKLSLAGIFNLITGVKLPEESSLLTLSATIFEYLPKEDQGEEITHLEHAMLTMVAAMKLLGGGFSEKESTILEKYSLFVGEDYSVENALSHIGTDPQTFIQAAFLHDLLQVLVNLALESAGFDSNHMKGQSEENLVDGHDLKARGPLERTTVFPQEAIRYIELHGIAKATAKQGDLTYELSRASEETLRSRQKTVFSEGAMQTNFSIPKDMRPYLILRFLEDYLGKINVPDPASLIKDFNKLAQSPALAPFLKPDPETILQNLQELPPHDQWLTYLKTSPLMKSLLSPSSTSA